MRTPSCRRSGLVGSLPGLHCCPCSSAKRLVDLRLTTVQPDRLARRMALSDISQGHSHGGLMQGHSARQPAVTK